MGPFMYGYPWFLWSWPRPEETELQRARRTGETRPRRLFGRRRAAEEERRRADDAEQAEDVAAWRIVQLLIPLTEDDLIAFGRELEGTDEVVSRLMEECRVAR